jgi:hypothetical protein
MYGRGVGMVTSLALAKQDQLLLKLVAVAISLLSDALHVLLRCLKLGQRQRQLTTAHEAANCDSRAMVPQGDTTTFTGYCILGGEYAEYLVSVRVHDERRPWQSCW